MIEWAKASGAGRLVAGGEPVGAAFSKGCYIGPTVFADVHANSEIARQEVFGPVLVIQSFKTEDEVLRIANSAMHGLGLTNSSAAKPSA